MLIHETGAGGNLIIDAYDGTQGISISGQRFRHSIWIDEERTTQWRPSSLADLREQDFEVALSRPPQILLLGTGERQLLDLQPLLPLIRAGIGFEFMPTAAACRTYNLLQAEGRRVTAALIIESA